MSEIEERGISRRNFLRAAGTLGVSGALLGAHVSGARGQEEREGDVSSAGAEHSSQGGNETTGSVDTSRFDPSKFLRDFYWGEERREGGGTVREYEITAEGVQVEGGPATMD